MGEKPPVARPLWVKVTLWGLRSRASALFYVWLCIAVAIVFAFLGFRNRWFLIGSASILGGARLPAGDSLGRRPRRLVVNRADDRTDLGSVPPATDAHCSVY